LSMHGDYLDGTITLKQVSKLRDTETHGGQPPAILSSPTSLSRAPDLDRARLTIISSQPTISESYSPSTFRSSPPTTTTISSVSRSEASAYDGFSVDEFGPPIKNSTVGRSYADFEITDRGVGKSAGIDSNGQGGTTRWGGESSIVALSPTSQTVTTELGETGETEIGKTTQDGYRAYSGLSGLSNYHQTSASPSSPSSSPASSPLPLPSSPLPFQTPPSHSSSPSSPARQMEGGRDRGSSNFSEEEPKDSDLCKVCFDARINCVILPCGHLALCMNCCKQLTLCPCCRTPIQMAKLVYRA